MKKFIILIGLTIVLGISGYFFRSQPLVIKDELISGDVNVNFNLTNEKLDSISNVSYSSVMDLIDDSDMVVCATPKDYEYYQNGMWITFNINKMVSGNTDETATMIRVYTDTSYSPEYGIGIYRLMNLPLLNHEYLLALDKIDYKYNIYGLNHPDYGMIPMDITIGYIDISSKRQYKWKDFDDKTMVIADSWRNDPTIMQYVDNLDHIIQEVSTYSFN